MTAVVVFVQPEKHWAAERERESETAESARERERERERGNVLVCVGVEVSEDVSWYVEASAPG